MKRGLKTLLTNLLAKQTMPGSIIWGDLNDGHNWASGTITVPDIDKYILFAVKPKNAATYMLAYRAVGDVNFRAFGGYVNATPNQFTYALTATVSGTTLTFVKSTNINVAGTSHTNMGVTAIIGLVPAP